MTAPNAPAMLVVSIDVEDAVSDPQAAAQRPVGATVDGAVDALLRFFSDRDVGATWNFADPAASPLAKRVLSDAGDHEISLRADANWAGPDVGRGRFANQLAQRLARAQDAGFSISTLSLVAGAVPQQLDLLVQHGITAVRPAETSQLDPAQATRLPKLHVWRRSVGDAENASQPRPLRWGLWSVPVGCDLLAKSARHTRHQIERAARCGALVHCLLDVPALLNRHGRTLRMLDAALTCILDQRDAGRLRISTVTRVVGTLGWRQSTPPARSILHRRAA